MPYKLVVILLALLLVGCQRSPVRLTTLVIGDAINDVDVKEKAEILLGGNIAVADDLLGDRLETLEDMGRPNHWLCLYRVPGDLLGTSRYVVETEYGFIAAVSKTIQAMDGAGDLLGELDLRSKLLGKPARVCEQAIGRPTRLLRDLGDNSLVRIYDVRRATELHGARYCVMRFDTADRCEQINLVGVSATTRRPR